MDGGELVQEVDDIMLPEVGLVHVPIVKGDFSSIPQKVQHFIAKYVSFVELKLNCFFVRVLLN